ncbi:hypothetical protein INR49_001253, partial [Caranx melampygus]
MDIYVGTQELITAMRAVKDLEEFLEKTEMDNIVDMHVGSLVALLCKPKYAFQGFEIYASETTILFGTPEVLYENRLIGLSVGDKNISGLEQRVNITMNITMDIPISADISSTDEEILTYITLIGCSLSLFALVITVFLFIINRNVREDVSMKIHINLVIALILLNIHFLTSKPVAALSSTWLCFYTAVCIHYSLLASFSWMALEGFHIYLLIVRVFNIYIKRYLLKLAVVGWGIPAVIVSLVLIIDMDAYGHISLDSTNTNSTLICYITDDTVKMVTTVGVFGLVFIFNICLFALTVKRVLTFRYGNESKSVRVKRDICTLMGLTILLGISWGLIFFTFGYLTIPGLYIFCILNSLQVCVNVSNSDIHINTSEGNIHDGRNNGVRCERNGSSCVFHCIDRDILRFNGTFKCFDAKVESSDNKTIYDLHPYSTCTMYLCRDSPISELVTSLDSQNAGQKEMADLFYIRDSCEELFRSSYKIKRDYINVERQIIHSIMGTSNLENGRSQIHKMTMLSLDAVNISDADLSSTEHSIQLDAPQLLPENASFVPDVWLPKNALRSISKEERIIGLVTYMQHDQFQFQQEEITSMVLRIEVLQGPLKNLNPPIQMTFHVSTDRPMDNESRLQCHYLDERASMHYSLLCCFTWMAIEALHLYLLLIKVFNTHYKHYLIKLSLAGWGLTSLMGTTWGLAFLGSGYVNYPILYLFCILNSMQ